jgi:hypothetical protein
MLSLSLLLLLLLLLLFTLKNTALHQRPKFLFMVYFTTLLVGQILQNKIMK